jgi:transposase
LEQDEFVKLCKQQTLTTTKDIAEECKTAFEDLDDIIGKYVESGKLTLKDRLKWPFVEKKVTLLRVNLDRLKSTLMLMLEVLKYARSIVK